jgi:hypothetical protein
VSSCILLHNCHFPGCWQQLNDSKLSATSNCHKWTVVHALQACDLASRMDFCNWFLQSIHNSEADLCFLPNNQYWSYFCPDLIHEVNFNLFIQYRMCVHVQGHHFQHLFIVLMERYLTPIGKTLQCLAVSHAARKMAVAW